MRVPCEVHIGHYTGGKVPSPPDAPRHVIEIRDLDGGAFIQIEMTHEQFGVAMAAQNVRVDVTFDNIDTLGNNEEEG